MILSVLSALAVPTRSANARDQVAKIVHRVWPYVLTTRKIGRPL
ncbi:MAG: hypothetical protein ACOH2H_24115 [Cypionkella sp.]